jgi:hypothetical protein
VAGICHPQKKVAFRAAVILPLWLLRSDMTNEPILLPVVPHSEGCEFLSLIEKYRGHQSTLHGRVFTLRDPGVETLFGAGPLYMGAREEGEEKCEWQIVSGELATARPLRLV